ncbi:MAG: hypothetical protein M1821_002956 [Bathelium mastoideum]|nr:MAG: hypothetical protein M1821_002956 [Bathelium mastoideum]
MTKRKRSHRKVQADGSRVDDNAISNGLGIGSTLALLSKELARESLQPAQEHEQQPQAPEQEWQTAESRSAKRRRKQREKSRDTEQNYPVIYHSPHIRLQSFVKISDLQALVLYLLADGTAPQWVAVRHHSQVRKIVVLMVPGLEAGMMDGTIPLSVEAAEPEQNKVPELGDAAQPITVPEPGIPSVQQANTDHVNSSPDDYYPIKLVSDQLPKPVQPLSDMFSHVWPIKTPGDDRYNRMYSPIAAMLTSPFPKSKEDKKGIGPQAPRAAKYWKDEPTPVTHFLASSDELVENEYVRHPLNFSSAEERGRYLQRRGELKQTSEHAWVDSNVGLSSCGQTTNAKLLDDDLTGGKEVIGMDCEMCKTADDVFELTRISLVSWDGQVLMDQLVKPDEPIVDYLTPYSGITADMLANVSTRLRDVQIRLLDILTSDTILVGHSLNSDLSALKITHPHIVDTSIIFPHPRGPPFKSSLKWLSQKYLGREIQTGHGNKGHDSIEDARASLDLVRQKCEKGPKWATSEASGEPIFQRLSRASRPKHPRHDALAEECRIGAVVDWGDVGRGPGAAAGVTIGCSSDAEVVQGIKLVINGEMGQSSGTRGGADFVWGRLRELEAIRGWWSRNKTPDGHDDLCHDDVFATQPSIAALAESTKTMVGQIKAVYEALPPRTAFIVYSGSGDTRALRRSHALYQQHRKELTTKHWNEPLRVQWTDQEQREMRRACTEARRGIGFVTVK